MQDTIHKSQLKKSLGDFIEALKDNHPKLETITEHGYSVHIRITDSRIDYSVMQADKPVCGQSLALSAGQS